MNQNINMTVPNLTAQDVDKLISAMNSVPTNTILKVSNGAGSSIVAKTGRYCLSRDRSNIIVDGNIFGSIWLEHVTWDRNNKTVKISLNRNFSCEADFDAIWSKTDDLNVIINLFYSKTNYDINNNFIGEENVSRTFELTNCSLLLKQFIYDKDYEYLIFEVDKDNLKFKQSIY